MIRRWLAIAAVLALVACGRATGPDEQPTVPPGVVVLTLDLDISPDPPMSGARVVWTLELTNEGSETVGIEMPSGQAGDVVLYREGAEVYRWSEGRAFTLALVNFDLEPGATERHELEEGTLAVEPGTYDLEASSTATPAPPVVQRTITVG